MTHYFFSKYNAEVKAICSDILGTSMGQLYHINGKAGMGKTTFLRYLKEQLEGEGKTVLLLDSSEFRCLHMDAVCVRNKATEFFEQMCRCDILEIDNIEDISTSGVLSSLLTIMTKMKNKGGRMVFTSALQIHELNLMGERIRAMFDESIAARLADPDEGELMSFLSFMSDARGIELSGEKRQSILNGCTTFAQVTGRFMTELACHNREYFDVTKNMNQSDESKQLDSYLTEIGNYPLLSIEDEFELATRTQNGDDEAIRQLVNCNRRYVVSVALLYQGDGKSLEELIKAGNVGLETAARNFQPDSDFKFIAYAVWYIRQRIEEILNPQ